MSLFIEDDSRIIEKVRIIEALIDRYYLTNLMDEDSNVYENLIMQELNDKLLLPYIIAYENSFDVGHFTKIIANKKNL